MGPHLKGTVADSKRVSAPERCAKVLDILPVVVGEAQKRNAIAKRWWGGAGQIADTLEGSASIPVWDTIRPQNSMLFNTETHLLKLAKSPLCLRASRVWPK